jgi:O-antigen ligase
MAYKESTTYIFSIFIATLIGILSVVISNVNLKIALIIPVCLLILFFFLTKKLYIELFLWSFLVGDLTLMGVKQYLLVNILVFLFVFFNISKLKINDNIKIIFLYLLFINLITLFSVNIENSFHYLVPGLLSVCIFYFGLIQLNNFYRIKNFMLCISVLLIIVSLIGIVQLFQWNAFYSSGYGIGRLNTLLGRSNAYAGLLTLVIPVVFFFGIIEKRLFPKIVQLSAAFILIASLILTASKGGLLTFLFQVLLIILLILIKFKFVKSLKILTISCVFISVIFIAFNNYISKYLLFISLRFQDISNTDSTTARLDMWKSALDLFENHIIFGVGFGNFSYFYPEYKHVHNLYLETLVEGGIIGFIMLIGIMVFIIIKCVALFNSSNSTYGLIGVGFIGSLAGVFINNTIEPLHSSFMLSGYSYGWFYWLFLAILFSMSKMKGDFNGS